MRHFFNFTNLTYIVLTLQSTAATLININISSIIHNRATKAPFSPQKRLTNLKLFHTNFKSVLESSHYQNNCYIILHYQI